MECTKSISPIGLTTISLSSSKKRLQKLSSINFCRKSERYAFSLGQLIESSRNWALKQKMTKELEKKNMSQVSMSSLALSRWASTPRSVSSVSFSCLEKRRRFSKKRWKIITICITLHLNRTHCLSYPKLIKQTSKTNPVWVKAVHPNNLLYPLANLLKNTKNQCKKSKNMQKMTKTINKNDNNHTTKKM